MGSRGCYWERCAFCSIPFDQMDFHVRYAENVVADVKKLKEKGFWLIDCQQQTAHLESLGGRAIPRKDFLDYMQKNSLEKSLKGNWNELFITQT